MSLIARITALSQAIGADVKALTGGKVDKAAGQSLMLDAERSKLDGIEAGATVNAADAQLRDRSTHTGEQAMSTVVGLGDALAGKQDTLVSGTNIKTINGTSLLGGGDLVIEGGGGGAGVSLEGPTGIYITQSVQFQITDYDVFSGYLVQVSAGTASIAGSTISFTAPLEAGAVTLTVFAGDYQRDIHLDILPERPAAPTITSPAATGVMGNPTLSTGAFSLIGPNTDTHAATDWEIWTGAGRTGTLVWSSLNNSANKLSITLPQDTLTVATDYHMAARHIGATFGAGDWATQAFRTADQFLPTVIGQAFGGGFYAGKIRYADGDYIIIVAPKSAETSLSHKTANSATAGTSSYHDGLANSNNMNNATHPAAQYCRAYAGGGFSDWHLPARDQLELLYRNLKPDTTANITGARGESGNHGDNANSVPAGASYTAGSPAQTAAAAFKTGGAEAFTVPTWYWTSTEYAPGTSLAWIQRFSDGGQGGDGKAYAYRVRPVRRLKI